MNDRNGNGTSGDGEVGGLRVAVELIECSPASRSMLDSAQSFARGRLSRGLLCSRLRRDAASKFFSRVDEGRGRTSTLSAEEEVSIDEREETDRAADGETNGEGKAEGEEPTKSLAVAPAPVDLLDAGDERWDFLGTPRGAVTWYKEPYAHVVMIACADLEEMRKVRPMLRAAMDTEHGSGQEMLIAQVVPTGTEATMRVQRRIFERIKDEIGVRRGIYCCRINLSHASAASSQNAWVEFEGNIAGLIRTCFDAREKLYNDDIEALLSTRGTEAWDIGKYYLSHESFAMLFEKARFVEEAYWEYRGLEEVLIDCAESSDPSDFSGIKFGGLKHGDEASNLCSRPDVLMYRAAVSSKKVTELMLRQYVFAREAQFLSRLKKYPEVLLRGIAVVQSLARALRVRESELNFMFREAWVYNACIDLSNSVDIESIQDGLTQSLSSRLCGDLLCYARVEFCAMGKATGVDDALEAKGNEADSTAVRRRGSSLFASPSSSPFMRLSRALNHRASCPKIQPTNLSFEDELLTIESGAKNKVTAAAIIAEGSPVEEDITEASAPYREAGSLSWLSDSELKRSLSSVHDFEERFLDLSREASKHYRMSGRIRQAAQIDLEIADVHISRQRYASAAVLLKQTLEIYRREDWRLISFSVLSRLRKCYAGMQDEVKLTTTCLSLLAYEQFCRWDDVEELQNEFYATCLGAEASLIKSEFDLGKILQFQGFTKLFLIDRLPAAEVETLSSSPCVECTRSDDIVANDVLEIEIEIYSSLPKELEVRIPELKFLCFGENNSCREDKTVQHHSKESTLLKPGKNTLSMRVQLLRPGTYFASQFLVTIGNLQFVTPLAEPDFFNLPHPGIVGGREGQMPSEKNILYLCRAKKNVLRATMEYTLPDASDVLVPGDEQYVGIRIAPIRDVMKGATIDLDVRSVESEGSLLVLPQRVRVVPNASEDWSNLDGAQEWSGQSISLPQWAEAEGCTVWAMVKPDAYVIKDGHNLVSATLSYGHAHCHRIETKFSIGVRQPFRVKVQVKPVPDDDGGGGAAAAVGVPLSPPESPRSDPRERYILQFLLKSSAQLPASIHEANLDLQYGYRTVNDLCRDHHLFPLHVGPSLSCVSLTYIIESDLAGVSANQRDAELSTLSLRYTWDREKCTGVNSELIRGEQREFRYGFTPSLENRSVSVSLVEPSMGQLGVPLKLQWQIRRLVGVGDNHVKGVKLIPYDIEYPPGDWLLSGKRQGTVCVPLEKDGCVHVTCDMLPMRAGSLRAPVLRLNDPTLFGDGCVETPLILRINAPKLMRIPMQQKG